MIKKVPIKEKGLVRATFELPSTMWAERVNLIGEFNDWDTMSTPQNCVTKRKQSTGKEIELDRSEEPCSCLV
jgi:hypothetical protein